MEQNNKEFASRLKHVMLNRGIKQMDLSRKTGIPKASISQYLKGTYIPSANRMLQIAEALNVDVCWLAGNKNISVNSLEDISELTKRYTQLNANNKERLLSFARDLSR